MRIKALSAILLFAVAAVLAKATAINPTTTFTTETANNTSGALTATQSNGNVGATNISKVDLHTMLPSSAASLPILAVYQPWFRKTNHMEIGIDEYDPATVAHQIEDAQSRGVSGFMVNWYGQPINADKQFMDTVTQSVRSAAEAHNGFSFALQYDGGAYKNCNCDKTQKFIADMYYARTTYFNSPAYLKVNNRPVVEMFSVDEDGPVDWTAIRAAVPELMMIFRNSGGWNHAQSDGMFGWLGINSDASKALSYDTDFYWNARQHTDKLVIAPIWLGFNDTLAAWSQNRITPRNCGQTYLQTVADAGANIASIDFLELNTWNDYEEGTEFETGIDNCVAVSATMTGTVLNWTISGGQENTIDHYEILASTDGLNAARLATVATGVGTIDLAQFNLDPAPYTISVKAVGKPSITNQMSAPVTFTVTDPGPVVSLSVTPDSGIAPATVAVTVNATSPFGSINSTTIDFGDGTVAAAASAMHVYGAAGTYNITARVTDSFGTSATQSTQVKVVPNKPPLAVIGIDVTNGVAPATVNVSSVGSTDTDGSITASWIDFGDGTPAVSGSTAAHVYSTPGTYVVTTSVMDDKGAKTSATATLTLGAPGVVISQPTPGSSTTSPVHVVASAIVPTGRTASVMRIYVDNVSAYNTSGGSLDTTLAMATGQHNVIVQVWDSTGTVYKASTNVTVAAPAPVAGVSVSSPSAGATVGSPVHFVASATAASGLAITTMRIYVDYVSKYSISGAKLDTYVSMSSGQHPVTVQAWDSSGAVYKWSTTVSVK